MRPVKSEARTWRPTLTAASGAPSGTSSQGPTEALADRAWGPSPRVTGPRRRWTHALAGALLGVMSAAVFAACAGSEPPKTPGAPLTPDAQVEAPAVPQRVAPSGDFEARPGPGQRMGVRVQPDAGQPAKPRVLAPSGDFEARPPPPPKG